MTLIKITLLLLFLILYFTTSIANNNNNNNNKHGLKSMHFTLYQQDLFNKTDFMILEGKGGPTLSADTAPLGSVFVLKDPLTLSPNPTSKQLGTSETLLVTHTKDGVHGIAVIKFSLGVNGHEGSLSISGVLDYKMASDYPVAGGTGDFLFVQGYVTGSPFAFHGLDTIWKYQFHLFWPTYAYLK